MIKQSLLVALLASVLSGTSLAQDLVIRGARVITGKNARARKANILITNGRIAKIGRLGRVPGTLPVIEAAGRIVTPAFILAHTSEGLDRPNERMPVVPFLSVRDAIDPGARFFENSLRDGHLTMLVIPGNATVIGGMGMIVHPFGLTVEQMTVAPEAGLKLSLIPPSGNRAAHMARLRGALDRARALLARLKLEGKVDPSKLSGNWDKDLKALEVARRDRPLMRLLKGELKAYVACGTAGDVLRAYQLISDYKLRATLVLGPKTWRAAKLVASHGKPVILSPLLVSEEPDPESGEPVRHVSPKIFHEAGVRFAVTSSSSSLGRRYLWYQAASLVRYGLTRKEALAAITTIPASILGLEKSKGTLEPGKDADLLILTADPFSGRAWVDLALIEGHVAYNRRHDPRLAEIFGTKDR